MSYTVIDDFLPKDLFEELYKALDTKHFPWYTDSKGIAYDGDNTDKFFIHTFYVNGTPNSDKFHVLEPILNKLNPKALIRARANLYVNNTNLIEHGSHVDYAYEHKAFILYLNTNDGFTRMDDGSIVNSVANRGVFFDGSLRHNSTNCTDAPCRMNISINYF